MTDHTSMLHVQVDEEIRRRAAETLDGLGLSLSDAVGLFLQRVVAERGFPLDLKVPNVLTREAMREADTIAAAGTSRFRSANDLFAALEEAGRA